MEKCKFINGNERILRHTNWHVEDYEFYTEGILSWKCFTFNFHKIDDDTKKKAEDAIEDLKKALEGDEIEEIKTKKEPNGNSETEEVNK